MTSWGESARTRLSSAQTGRRLAVMEYHAPAAFGPPRHVHHDDDEIFIIARGTIAVWTEDASSLAGPGDLVFLPRAVPHTWRAYGPEPVHFHLIVAPGAFETFFDRIAARGLAVNDQADLAEIGHQIGATFLGPSLSDDDVASILRACAATVPEIGRTELATAPIGRGQPAP